MSRKATNSVTTIGIDSGKNSFHLIGLDARFGSESDILRACPERLLLRAKQTFSVENRTSRF